MLNLIKKDFKVGIKFLIYVVGILLVVDTIMIDDRNMLGLYVNILLSISIYSYVSTALTYDTLNRTTPIILSLPIKRREIVLSKYINIIVGIVLGTLAIHLLLLASSLIKGVNGWEFIDVRNSVVLIMLLAIIFAIMIPTVIKFGPQNSRVVTMVFMSLIIITSLVFKDFTVVIRGITSSNIFLVGGMVLVTTLMTLSYRVSVKIFEESEC